ncbi:hypothetical protein [Streptacidiphilus sp. P02-A3a]|uniref:alpha/beta hydrolase family protein n=1 Tax=Streptacidiphilus sp. P02-A3a TaxID=2704468 RepID=UPI00272B8F0A|nr:hypothetical protein [Streptacidiphilus sp. P02-A3a]QMU67631.1 hypothetical protein GXP74_04710 [Streptacidiphilus sp. P02-A3a]
MIKPEIRELADPSRRNWDAVGPRPVRAYLWEPAFPTLDPPPLVLLSHGTGGSAQDLAWLAEALTGAGFLVAGVDHHGNNWVDGYLPEGFAFDWERPRDLGFLLGELTRERRLGPVGAAGFSLGGYTAAATVGARIDPERVRAVAEGLVPAPPLPEFPDLIEALRARIPQDQWEPLIQGSAADVSVPQVLAAFLICPAVGELIDESSLPRVTRPVAIRWGGADDICPGPENALRYARHIPRAEAVCVGESVGHYVFVDGTESGEPVRAAVAADAVAFFRAELGAPRPR